MTRASTRSGAIRRACAVATVALIAGAGVVAAKGPAGGPAGPVLPAIEGTNRADRLVGTPRAESITAYLGDDRINGGGGDDVIDAREGADRITTPAGPGAANIAGGPGHDRIVARGAGADVLHGMGGRDRLVAGPGPDRLFGGPGADRLSGGAGDDVLDGGPGYDALRGGDGDDRLRDVSDGAGLLEGGRGDDLIRAAPRGMHRVRCGPGADTVVADALDIVRADCEVVDRTGPARRGEVPPRARLTTVRSLAGAVLGTTGYRLPADTGGPLRLLWVNDGFTYLSARFRGDDACFLVVEPSGGGRAECGIGPRGGLFVRRIDGRRFRWIALTPAWARSLVVAGRTVTVRGGVASFVAGRHPRSVVARGAGRSAPMRVP